MSWPWLRFLTVKQRRLIFYLELASLAARDYVRRYEKRTEMSDKIRATQPASVLSRARSGRLGFRAIARSERGIMWI